MFNLNEFMDNRSTFQDVSYSNTKLQIVSLGTDLVEKLKALTTHKSMFDFVAEQGLAWNNTRISEGVKAEALTAIWDSSSMQTDKADIVDAICTLSDVSSILSDKLKEEKELAVLQEKEDKLQADEVKAHEENDNLIKKALNNNPHIELGQLADDNAVDENLNP